MGIMLGKLARLQTQNAQMETITYWGDNGGLVTVIPEKEIGPDDFSDLINIRYEKGKRRTREGLYRMTAAALAGGKFYKTLALIPIAGTPTLFAVSDDYKLYKLNNAEPNMTPSAAIATLAADAQLIPFGGYVVICDSGYLKYYDNANVGVFYDNGDLGFWYNPNITYAPPDGYTNLYSGSTVRVGEYTASPNTGYTWPMKEIHVWLAKTNFPTGNIRGIIYNAAGDMIVRDNVVPRLNAQNLTVYPKLYKFTFSGTALANNTSYRFGVSFSGGDDTNYVKVGYKTVASGGLLQTYTEAGGWAASDETKNVLIALKPGLPPKASFAAVADSRLHVVDPQKPGGYWICGPDDPYDWSTTDYAGWIPCVDDNVNSYPIGAIVPFLNSSGSTDIWALGRAAQPFLTRLMGDNPSNWVLAMTGQEAYSDWKSVQVAVNDVFFASKLNCHSLQASDKYGDINVTGPGGPVKNLFETYWTTAAFSGYWGITGQYFIQLPGYANILVCHTKDGAQRWSQYLLKGLTPKAFLGANDIFYVACSDGHLYRLKSDLYTDNGTAYDITMTGGVLEFPFSEMQLVRIYHMITTHGATTGKLYVYRNGSGTALRTLDIAAGTVAQHLKCTMNAKSLKIKMDTVAFTATTYFDKVIIRARHLYGLGQR